APRGGNAPAGRGSDQPRDIYALRAAAAGITGAGVPGRGPGDRDRRGAPAAGAPGRGPGGPSRGGRGKRKTREQIEQELLTARNNVNKVMASLSRTPVAKARLKDRKAEGEGGGEEQKRILNVSEFVTIGELAGLMNVLPAQVIAKCMELGMMVTINQRLDHEIIALVADEFGYTAKLMDEYAQETEDESADDEAGG